MKRRTAAPLFLACVLCLAAEHSGAQTPSQADAEAEIEATNTDFAKDGILSIGRHTDGLEHALAEGTKIFPPPPTEDGTIIVLADGQLETLAVAARAATAKQRAKVVFNPYPTVALYLALYYNEVHKPEDALRAIDAGLKLSTPDGLLMGAHMPNITTEQGTALNMLKRFQEGFDVCDAGLKLLSARNVDQARMYRCRGFSLTELGRLDEAQQSYEESLKLEPNNPIAKNEIEYLSRLRAGAAPKPPAQVLSPIPQEPPEKTGVPPKPI